MRTFLLFLWRFRFSLLLAGLVFYLSVMRIPSPVRVLFFPGADKVIHLILYFLLALALMFEAVLPLGTKRRPLSAFALVFLLPAFYGALIELLQQFCFPPRTCNWLDWVFDALGALIAFLAYSFFFSRRSSNA